MADFPRITYKQIDGRPTAFTEPQHFTSGDETVRTGEDNPLPTKDGEVKTELESIKAMQQQILERLDEPIDTQVTGSNAEEIKVFDALALTDTSLVDDTLDLSAYKRLFIIANSSHDVPVTFYFYVGNDNNQPVVWLDGEWSVEERSSTLSLFSTSRYALLHTKHKWLETYTGILRVGVKADTSPTSGSLSFTIWGVK